MPILVALLVAIVLAGAQAASAIAPPGRDDVVRAIVRAGACVDVDVGVRLALLCPGPDELAPLEREARALRRAAEAAGVLWRGDLDHFAKFCRTLTLDNGRRFVLEDFQRTILRDYFAGASETLVLIPKKNGKTTLMAALVLYHLFVTDDAEGYVAASSRDQAGLLYKFARRFVNRSPGLQRRVLVRPGTRELRSRRDDGFARVLAADSDTADGVGPTLAIVDELHRHKSTALYEVFRDGLGAREGGMLTITTAGDDEDGPLGQMRAGAHALPGKTTDGRYTYVRSRDGSFALHEWALGPKDDLEDLDLVKSVNPLRSMTKAKLRRRRNSPSMSSHAWARFACNVWTADESAAIAALDWAAIGLEGCQLPDGDPPGGPPVIGVDLGWTKDSSAFVPVGYPTEERDLIVIDARLRVVPSPGDGTMQDEEVLKAVARELAGIWPGALWAIDPNAGGQAFASWVIQELCNGDEERVATVSQQPASMQSVSMHLAECIRTRGVVEPELDEHGDPVGPRVVPIRHPDHPDLNRHVRATVARYAGERWRFDKRRVPSAMSSRVKARPIDGVIGTALGVWVLNSPIEEELEPFAFGGATA